MRKTALITGASSGIGKAAARELCGAGFIVYAAARRTERMADIKSDKIIPIALDLTDDASIESCVKTILEKEGHIDVLVNNAGYGSYGAVENVPMPEARRQFEVNVFGLARLVQLVAPSMREQKCGRIVNISSMAGKVWTNFGGWYHAAKFAVEGLSDCMRTELAPFGIKVIIIEPGCIKTAWGGIAADNLENTAKGGAYESAAAKSANVMRKIYSHNITPPEKIAELIRKAVTAKRPKTRYMRGFLARPAVFIRRVFGDRVYDWVLKKFD